MINMKAAKAAAIAFSIAVKAATHAINVARDAFDNTCWENWDFDAYVRSVCEKRQQKFVEDIQKIEADEDTQQELQAAKRKLQEVQKEENLHAWKRQLEAREAAHKDQLVVLMKSVTVSASMGSTTAL